MTPPKLAGDTPGLDILHPLEIGLFPVLRHEVRCATPHRLACRLRNRVGVDIPLVGQKGLDDDARAIALRPPVRIPPNPPDETTILTTRDAPPAPRTAAPP